MAGSEDDEGRRGYASPPCFMHEVDPDYMGGDMQQEVDVLRWRHNQRGRLIDARLAIPAAERQAHAEAIMWRLDEIVGDLTGKTVSSYWPIRGEPDLRTWLEAVVPRGGRSALPVVMGHGVPLAFRLWRKGEVLERGVRNIPAPTNDLVVEPDIIIAPVVGFDRACYRLGYGGGYFDQTIAAAETRPRFIGIGFAASEVATIYPQPHDVAMDVIVTEREAIWR